MWDSVCVCVFSVHVREKEGLKYKEITKSKVKRRYFSVLGSFELHFHI